MIDQLVGNYVSLTEAAEALAKAQQDHDTIVASFEKAADNIKDKYQADKAPKLGRERF
jgi:hypothetical protein